MVKPFNERALDASVEALDLLVKKQNDYGPKNIMNAPGGPMVGLAVRLHDKVARLANIIGNDVNPNFESLRDTMLDIANYGLIGVMVLDDTFDPKETK
jgi:hypothetical protein